MADYWIKWYHEIIDDPKMATLPDRLWRRFSELCLLAGRLCPDKSGKLPDTRQLAWALRMNSDELQLDLVQLARIDLVESIPNGWLIVNFAKRQRAATSTERVHQHRERKQKQQYNGDETELKRNVTQNRLTEHNITDIDNSASPLTSEFTKLTGILPYDLEKWIEADQTMTRAGITPEEIGITLKVLEESNFTVAGLWSITKTAISVKSKRDRHQPIFSSGGGKENSNRMLPEGV